MSLLTPPSLDERLKTVFELFPACDVGADIGADHGRLSCNLLYSHKAGKMLITDISETSLEKAKKLILLHSLEKRASFCVGDGLKALNESVRAAAICGMGGKVISGILNDGYDCLTDTVLVMSPQTDNDILRDTVYSIGYHIDDERVAYASGRFYTVMRAVPGKEEITDKERFLSPVLMNRQDPYTRAYYQWRLNVERTVRAPEHQIKVRWLEEVLKK